MGRKTEAETQMRRPGDPQNPSGDPSQAKLRCLSEPGAAGLEGSGRRGHTSKAGQNGGVKGRVTQHSGQLISVWPWPSTPMPSRNSALFYIHV